MPFTYRDRPKLSERLLGRSGEEILNEMKCDLDNERRMFFDSPWGARSNSSGFPRGFPFDDRSSRTNVRSYLDNLASRHPEFADQLKEPPWSEDFGNPSFGGNRSRTSNPGKSFQNQDHIPGEESQGRHQNLNHFGLRNTVPLGQNANPEEQRRQRSMSAPPENRNTDRPKKFVSKCEIPIMHDPEESGKSPSSSPLPKTAREQAQAKAGNSSNVRLIPIKVEGRDEPIINADVDVSANFASEKMQAPFEARLPRDFGSYQKHSPRFAHKAKAPPPQPQPQAKAHCPSQAEPMPMPMPGPPPPPPPSTDEVDSKPAEAVKVEPLKDPRTKVELIQKEVDQLKQEVEAYEGKSRTDKQFMMLDELLTRKLISLDDIDTEGKEDVRQARKDTIRSIQRCISLLESRVPPVGNNDANDSNANDSTALVPVGSMEVDTIKDKSTGVDATQTEDVTKGAASGEASSF